MAKLPDTDEIDLATKAFEPYFMALGKVAHAWNHLHEELGRLFCLVTGLDNSMGMSIWHALKSDRGQRDLLSAAMAAATSDEDWTGRFPKAEDGVRWVLKETNKLANQRNDAIHAPCSVIYGDGGFEIFAFSFSGNPKAKNLRDKDILMEFLWYESSADTIKHHVREIQFALSDPRVRWPENPLMPTQGQG